MWIYIFKKGNGHINPFWVSDFTNMAHFLKIWLIFFMAHYGSFFFFLMVQDNFFPHSKGNFFPFPLYGWFFFLSHSKGDFIFLSHSKVDFFSFPLQGWFFFLSHSTGDFFFLSHSKGDFIFLSHSKGDFFLKNFLPPPPPGYLMVRPLGIYI